VGSTGGVQATGAGTTLLAGARAILTRHDQMGSDSVLQRQGSALGDALHDKGRREALYAGQGGKLFVIEALKCC
jgi:hypothetical protein